MLVKMLLQQRELNYNQIIIRLGAWRYTNIVHDVQQRQESDLIGDRHTLNTCSVVEQEKHTETWLFADHELLNQYYKT